MHDNSFYILPETMDRIDKMVERYPETYFKVKSWTRPGIFHLVRRLPYGWVCDCEDFTYRHSGRRGGMCDHIRKVRHLKTRCHRLAEKRKKELAKATRALTRVNLRFAKDARRLGFYQNRTATAKNQERAKFYAGHIKPILKNLEQLKKEGTRLIRKYPELAK